jgi:heparosan-N-sulfate-glucuronate 5-epimerase
MSELIQTHRHISSRYERKVGPRYSTSAVAGYYIDLRIKASDSEWPPHWLEETTLYVRLVQWALGCYERYLAGEGDAWLHASAGAGTYLLERQWKGSSSEGAWLHTHEFPHTFHVASPWASGLVQGQAASLLVRLYLATGEPSFAEGARRALLPLEVPVAEGGMAAALGGRPFPEEYPTDPPSFVLNGAIDAHWGQYDVWLGLGDASAGRAFAAAVETLATNLHRWDLGYWSRYDLYPHPVRNPASPWYHQLHICQLRVMNELAPRAEFDSIRSRFEAYAASPVCLTRALAQKALFRLRVPRSRHRHLRPSRA